MEENGFLKILMWQQLCLRRILKAWTCNDSCVYIFLDYMAK